MNNGAAKSFQIVALLGLAFSLHGKDQDVYLYHPFLSGKMEKESTRCGSRFEQECQGRSIKVTFVPGTANILKLKAPRKTVANNSLRVCNRRIINGLGMNKNLETLVRS